MVRFLSFQIDAGVSEWQTRQTQNLLWATTCGFKSRCRQCKKSVYTGFFILFKNDYVRAKTSTSSAWILVLPLGMMVLSPLLIMMIRK